MAPVDSSTEAPPSSRLSGSPTPPSGVWLSLRPILAGFVVLAVGLPAVWLLARADPHAKPTQSSAVVRTPNAAAHAPLPAQQGEPTTLVAVPPRTPTPAGRAPATPSPSPGQAQTQAGPEAHSRPVDPDRKADRDEAAARPAAPSHAPHPSAHPEERARPNITWIKSECARRFPEDDMRRAYCESMLAQLAR